MYKFRCSISSTRPLTHKPNFQGHLVSRFYPICEIHKKLMHAKTTCFAVVSSNLGQLLFQKMTTITAIFNFSLTGHFFHCLLQVRLGFSKANVRELLELDFSQTRCYSCQWANSVKVIELLSAIKWELKNLFKGCICWITYHFGDSHNTERVNYRWTQRFQIRQKRYYSCSFDMFNIWSRTEYNELSISTSSASVQI